MIKFLVDSIKEVAEHIKGVQFFNYSGVDKINAQNNNHTIQLWVEDDIYTEYLVTKDIVKMTVNIDILDKLYQGDLKQDVHDNTYKIGVVLLKLLESSFQDKISINDYSIMTLSDYSDDELYGVRLTISLFMPSPITVCNIDDYIDELNKYYKQEENQITIDTPKIDISNININPIKVKKNARFTK